MPRSSQWSLPSGSPNQNHVNTTLPSPMHAPCPTHLVLLNLITLTIFSEEYKLWSSSSCNFLHDPSSSLPQSERPSFTPIQHNWQNYSFVYFNLQVSWYEMGRQKIFDWVIASIPQI
jgi:hypothetical protein